MVTASECLKLANELRGEGEKPRSPAEILATFFDASDTLLTRIEAGVAAHLLCQAMASHPGLRAVWSWIPPD